MLEIKLFGAGEARYCNQPLVGFPGQQSYLLLCYLLINRRYPLCRERLAAVFWDDYPTVTARKHLSKALWRLRHALQAAGAPVDEYLLTSKDAVSFLNSKACRLDVEIFDATVTRYQDISGAHLTAEQAAQLEEVTTLYTGDLLEGVYEDWVVYERERLSVLHLKALGKLMTYHEMNGAYERALTCGERILFFDKAHEKTHQQMMRLYWRSGDRSAALAQYKRCIQILRDETGFPPTSETKFLYQQMIHNQFSQLSRQSYPSAPFGYEDFSDETLQELTVNALQKLSRLQKIVEETTAELHSLEDLLALTLAKSR